MRGHYLLLERDGSTLPDLLRLYADKTFRREITTRVRNPVVRRYWLAEFEHYPEVRKYGLGLTLAHQYLAQLEPDVRHAVLANAGTLASFRVGPEDAAILAPEFEPTFGAGDLLTLPNRHFYLKLLIGGAPSRPFSARTRHAD